MHTEIVEGALGEQLGDLAGNPADAGLQGATAVDELQGILGDRHLDLVGGRVGQVQWLQIGLQQEVDLIDMEAVLVLRRQTEGVGEVGADLDDHEAVGVGPGTVELVDACTGVNAEAHPPVHRRSGRRRHDARPEVVEHRLEAAEVGRHEVNRRAGIAQEPLSRTEEPAAVVHPFAHEQLVEVGEQGAEHFEVLEVVALTEGVEEAARHTRSQGHSKTVVGADRCDGFAHRCDHGLTVRPLGRAV